MHDCRSPFKSHEKLQRGSGGKCPAHAPPSNPLQIELPGGFRTFASARPMLPMGFIEGAEAVAFRFRARCVPPLPALVDAASRSLCLRPDNFSTNSPAASLDACCKTSVMVVLSGRMYYTHCSTVAKSSSSRFPSKMCFSSAITPRWPHNFRNQSIFKV